MTNRAGPVYLAASSHGDAFQTMIKSALAAVPTRLGKRRPTVAVSYAAVADSLAGRTFMKAYAAKSFWGAEIHAFHVPGESSKMDPDKARKVVEEADVVFLTGGDPVLGARLLCEAGADAWLRDANARGAACMGMSAGAMMLCAWWAEWPDPLPEGAPWDGGKLVPCTGVVRDLVVDCHAEEDDWGELKLVTEMLGARAHERLGAAAKVPRCVGLPHGGGVVVRGEGQGELEWIGTEPFEI